MNSRWIIGIHVTLSLTIAAILLGAYPDGQVADPKDPGNKERIHVLIVTGTDIPAHPWREKSKALEAVLESEARFVVSITEDPQFLGDSRLFDYDVVLLNFYSPKEGYPDLKSRANLLRFVKDEGKGLFVLHFACGSFPDWPEYQNLAGRIWDRVNTHDQRGLFQVNITDRDHPVTKATASFETDDELYTCLKGTRKIDVLANARSKITGRDHPMAFAFSYGEGRVFHTPLGHDVKAIKNLGTARLIRRGCAWAADHEPARLQSSTGSNQ